MFPALSASLAETNTVSQINHLLAAARSHEIPVYYELHQQQYTVTSFDGWKHMKALHES